MSEELKPCPFCENAGELIEEEEGYGWTPGCSDECCIISVSSLVDTDILFSQKQEAIDAWNKRSPSES